MMNMILVVYMLLLVVGGIVGFKKAGSKVSLIMGFVSGLCVGIGIFVGGFNFVLGRWIVILTVIFLMFVFVIRLYKTKKFMPSGVILIMSLVVLIGLITEKIG